MAAYFSWCVLEHHLAVLADAVALGAVTLMAWGSVAARVLRLVNFAYGQLRWPVRSRSRLVGLGWLLGRHRPLLRRRPRPAGDGLLVFRPLRGRTPAVMLVATFAVAFLLQSIALVWFGPLGKIAASLGYLNRPVTISGVDIRKITIVAIVVALACLVALTLLLERTTIGLQMRASSMDSQTARLLGVRANRVIGAAVLISGALAAVVAVMLTVQSPLVTPDFALRDTIIVLAGVVLGGLNRPLSATWGFSMASRAAPSAGRRRPTRASTCRTFLFVAAILVSCARTASSCAGRRWSAYGRLIELQQLAPAVLVIATAFVGTLSRARPRLLLTDAWSSR